MPRYVVPRSKFVSHPIVTSLDAIHDAIKMARLLLVEDDLDVADALVTLLELDGHDVRRAVNGAEGLKLLDQGVLPDVVILDVEMPVLDGPGMAYRMLIHDVGLEEIPILLVSGAADLHRIAAGIGTPYYLAKPVSLDKFRSRLAQVLSERRRPFSMETR